MMHRAHIALGFLFCLGVLIVVEGCADRSVRPPNVLLIVWDTVRSDRMSLYGYGRPTTPFLEEWAKEALLFEDCVAPANYTVSSHASLFTGLMPSEHRAHNSHLYLNDELTTLAELLSQAGYRTYMYSANPHISKEENFDQGFDLAEYPWSDKYRAEALQIVKRKISPQDQTSELPHRIHGPRIGRWDIKASGELAERALLDWLKGGEEETPFFAFLNYMEAHRPYIPSDEHRRRLMSDEQVEASYRIDRSWLTQWSFTFGLGEYTDEELELTGTTYDATLVELDDLFSKLIAGLDTAGYLENTIIVLTSDHGEHLGEHHMLGHQYSLYEPLVRVPLVIHFPSRVEPGRESRPVMNHDLFPTLLQLTGVASPKLTHSSTVNLLSPVDDRVRVTESIGIHRDPIGAVKREHPKWNPDPWLREIRAVYNGDYKLIRSGDDDCELFCLKEDPGERDNLALSDPELRTRLAVVLDRYVATMPREYSPDGPVPELSDEQRELLRSLGYVEGSPLSSGDE